MMKKSIKREAKLERKKDSIRKVSTPKKTDDADDDESDDDQYEVFFMGLETFNYFENEENSKTYEVVDFKKELLCIR